MTIVRPFSKVLTDTKTTLLLLEWDKFFNDLQAALNNLQANASFTLAAAATTVVNDKRVTAKSAIALTPTNAAAGTLQGSAKALYVSARTAGVSFTVATASGVAAAGTEAFAYAIVG